MILAQGTDGFRGFGEAAPKFFPTTNKTFPTQALAKYASPSFRSQNAIGRSLMERKPYTAPEASNPAANAPATVSDPMAAMDAAANGEGVGPDANGNGAVVGDTATIAPKTAEPGLKRIGFVGVAALAAAGYIAYRLYKKRKRG